MRSGIHENPAGEIQNLAQEWTGMPSSAVQSNIAFQINVGNTIAAPRAPG